MQHVGQVVVAADAHKTAGKAAFALRAGRLCRRLCRRGHGQQVADVAVGHIGAVAAADKAARRKVIECAAIAAFRFDREAHPASDRAVCQRHLETGNDRQHIAELDKVVETQQVDGQTTVPCRCQAAGAAQANKPARVVASADAGDTVNGDFAGIASHCHAERATGVVASGFNSVPTGQRDAVDGEAEEFTQADRTVEQPADAGAAEIPCNTARIVFAGGNFGQAVEYVALRGHGRGRVIIGMPFPERKLLEVLFRGFCQVNAIAPANDAADIAAAFNRDSVGISRAVCTIGVDLAAHDGGRLDTDEGKQLPG